MQRTKSTANSASSCVRKSAHGDEETSPASAALVMDRILKEDSIAGKAAQHGYELSVLREESAEDALAELRSHVAKGLSAFPKFLSSKFFYDDLGSELYARITELEEYYPTRTEHAILEANAGHLVSILKGGGKDSAENSVVSEDEPINIVELGAGDGRKTAVLLRELQRTGTSFEYMPIDISRGAMQALFSRLAREFPASNSSSSSSFPSSVGQSGSSASSAPGAPASASHPIKAHGFVGDYVESLVRVSELWPRRRTVLLFLGSSIGNSSTEEAIDLLLTLNNSLKRGDLLLCGFDLKKDAQVLTRAYADKCGVTAAFNLNLLERINREVGAEFETSSFQHHAVYNPVQGTMESYLISRHGQDVRVGDQVVHFDQGEAVHTEYSHKYLPKDVHFMLHKAGFSSKADFFDEQHWFMDALAEIR